MKASPSRGLTFLFAMLASLLVTLCCLSAKAEKNEAAVGLSGGVLLPAFRAPTPTAFTLATWSAGVEGQYGITDNWSLKGSFTFASFGATTQAASFPVRSRTYSGALDFQGVYYHPEIGARVKLLGGYNVAPYIEFTAGYLWGVFNRPAIRTANGSTLRADDFAEGRFTAGAGVAVDWRLFNMLFAGLSARYVRTFGGGLAQQYVSVPLTVSFYW